MYPTIRVIIALCVFTHAAASQTRWDGGGGDSLWTNPLNWAPDGTPAEGSDVLLDHSLLKGVYSVALPPGNTAVSIARLRVLPEKSDGIRLLLPKTNTAVPALRLTGNGDCLVLGEGSTFTNSSGAGSGDPIAFSGMIRIENGATYIHNTARGNARVVERLSSGQGTERGVFVFDVPGSSAYTLSLSGRTFGTLVVKASSAGMPKRYNGSGSNPLTIRGGLVVETNATLGTTLTGDIRLMGGIRVEGALSLGPATAGTADRSLILTGTDTAFVSGSGSLNLLNNFRNIVADTGSFVLLERNLELATSSQSFLLRRNATLFMGENIVSGQGLFLNEPNSTLVIASADGVRHSGGLGNIQTALCGLDSASTYVFARNGPQSSGDALPTRIRTLKTRKQSGSLSLSRDTEVYSSLHLDTGRIKSSANAVLTLSGSGLFSPDNGYGDSNAGWERGFVDGPFRRVSTDTGWLVFPIGRDSVFAPVRLCRMQPGPAGFTAEYHPEPYAQLEPISNPPLAQVSKYEYWEVRVDGSAPEPASLIALSWRSSQGANASWRDSLRIAQYENRGYRLQWEPVGDRPLVIGTGRKGYAVSDRPWGSYGVLALASASPFAVLDRSGSRLGAIRGIGGVVLKWDCASATSCDGCELLRGGDWASLTEIYKRRFTERGASGVFEHTDRDPLPGRNLYRVSCRLGSGKRAFSEVASLYWEREGDLRIHPNPTSGVLYVEDGKFTGPMRLSVTDAAGRTVWPSMRMDGVRSRLDLTALRPGLYILHGSGVGGPWRLPFLKR